MKRSIRSLAVGILCFIVLLNMIMLSSTLAVLAMASDSIEGARQFGLAAAASAVGALWFFIRLKNKDVPLTYRSALTSYLSGFILTLLFTVGTVVAFWSFWPDPGNKPILLVINAGFILFGILIKLNDVRYLPQEF